jgi:hypothetical protein
MTCVARAHLAGPGEAGGVATGRVEAVVALGEGTRAVVTKAGDSPREGEPLPLGCTGDAAGEFPLLPALRLAR